VDGLRRVERPLARVEASFREGTITRERAHLALDRGAGADLKSGDVAPRCHVIAPNGTSTAGESRP